MEKSTINHPFKDSGNVEIIEYEERYAHDFATINKEWINEYFTLEQHDLDQLDHPFESIVKPGGQIFFARISGKIVGTVGLQVHGESFELVKMGVLPEYKGFKIGKKLTVAAINYARKTSKKSIILESNSRLGAALNLYQSMGFIEVATDPDSPYNRCDVRMELKLNE